MMALRNDDGSTFGEQAVGTIHPLPEPSTWALLIIAGLALVLYDSARHRPDTQG